MTRIASRVVELSDLLASNFLGDEEPLISIAVRTHLALEACLVELLRHAAPDKKVEAIWKLSFPAKTKRLEALGVISADDKQAFDRYNDLRNDFAHIFGHRVTLSEVLDVALELERCGVDFSDSVGSYSEAEAIEYYGGDIGVMSEISWCVLYHVAWLMFERGARDVFSTNDAKHKEN